MKERIAEFIRDQVYRPLTATELAEALGVPEAQQGEFLALLAEMESMGLVIKTRAERYGAPDRMNLVVGRLQGHPKGFGFLIPEAPGQDDVFIGKEAMGGAMHGDTVIARVMPARRSEDGANRREGEIIRILNRIQQRVVGTYEGTKKAGYVSPDDKRIPDDIFVAPGHSNGARVGEKVVVEIVRWPEPRRGAEGRVIERLGMRGAPGVDILSIIRKYQLPEKFPAKVLAEAEAIPDEIAKEEYAQRRDLRDELIVTIDGEDAKDLDDAVQVTKLGPDLWRLGVHIADVSYYVREETALDREAYTRATSVYLAGRVVPMLPPKLSNGICSLNPQVDRLTLSCLMEINGEGRVVRHELCASVIKTAARMTYNQVQGILDGDPDLLREYANLVPMIREMEELRAVLRAKRMDRGSLDFDLPETKLTLDPETGSALDVRRADRAHSHQIIEEFMLAANETVAEHFFKLKAPFCYRIHEEPAGDRIANLQEFLQFFGYRLKVGGKVTPKDLQGVTEWVKGRKEEGLVSTVLLRSMRQARYAAENVGHFGLAAEYYCHFTSPIRRYPDLLVHRAVRAAVVDKSLKAKRKARWEREMPNWAEHCSIRERVATDAERETLDLKKAEYMQDKVGQTFEGIISSVTNFGFFVQLPNTIEGLVHVSNLTDDYYQFNEKQYLLIGERTRKIYRLGDPVTVRVSRVNVEDRLIDFALEERRAERPPRPAGPVAPEQRSAGPAAPEQRSAGPAAPEQRREERGRQPARAKARQPREAAEIEIVPPPAAAPVLPGGTHGAAAEANRDQVRQAVLERVRAAAQHQADTTKAPKAQTRDMWGIPIPQREDRVRREEGRRLGEDESISRAMLRSIKLIDRRRRTKPTDALPTPAGEPAAGDAPALRPSRPRKPAGPRAPKDPKAAKPATPVRAAKAPQPVEPPKAATADEAGTAVKKRRPRRRSRAKKGGAGTGTVPTP